LKRLTRELLKGVLAGYPVVNLKATLVDGSYHTVDSSEMALRLLLISHIKKDWVQANPVLLEPIYHLEVYVPEATWGISSVI
jgi:elongation factor G